MASSWLEQRIAVHDIPVSLPHGDDAAGPSVPIRRATDAGALAVCVAARVEELLARKPDSVLLLPAGGTPVPLYRELARRRTDVSRTRVVQLDELVGVGPDDPRSFHAFLRRHWLEALDHAPSRALLLDGAASDPEAEIARHAAALAALGPPDLVLLGIGLNGHVAFNEPGTAPDAGARVVELAARTREAQAPAFAPDEPPTHGMTLGLRELAGGAATWLLASGASKAPVLARLLSERPSPALPASLLAGDAGFELFADEAALGNYSE